LAKKHGPNNGLIYRLEFAGEYNMCQVKGYANSKEHPECISLPILFYDTLGDDWINAFLDKKTEAGRLWLPCLTKAEVDRLLSEIDMFRRLRPELFANVRYWDDLVLVDPLHPSIDPEGEVFFETAAGYYLRPVAEP